MLQSVATVILAYFFRGVVPSFDELLGAVLCMIGLLLASWPVSWSSAQHWGRRSDHLWVEPDVSALDSGISAPLAETPSLVLTHACSTVGLPVSSA